MGSSMSVWGFGYMGPPFKFFGAFGRIQISRLLLFRLANRENEKMANHENCGYSLGREIVVWSR